MKRRAPVLTAGTTALILAAACDPGQLADPAEEASLTIVPDSVTLTYIGERSGFSVQVSGSVGSEAIGEVTWSSTDTMVFTVDTDGGVTARGNGSAFLWASSPKARRDVAGVRVEQAVATMEALGGDQRVGVGFALLEPVGVRLVDAGGTVVPPTLVRFDAIEGGGWANPGAVWSDSAGVAWTKWTLGPASGRQVLEAKVANGERVEIGAIALEPEAAVVVLVVHSGDGQWAPVSQTLAEPVVVRLVDAGGRRVPGARVWFEPAAGSGRVDPAVVVSDAKGLAATAWTLGDVRGEQTLVATVVGGPRVKLSARAQSDEGVCGRTPAVGAEIARQAGVADCAEVTEGQLPEIEELGLRDQGIRSLRSGDFAGLAGLRGLYLTRNRLGDLPPDLFAGLPRLQQLNLGSNELATLPPDLFAGLTELRVLTLSGNPLTELPPDIFSELSELHTLWLHGDLTELPPGVFAGLGNLLTLALSWNRLTGLPPGIFVGLARLRWLDLGENDLAVLPPEVFAGLSSLEHLILDRTQLTELPPGIFAGLSNLRSLDLQWSDLTELPPGIFAGLRMLERLDLSANKVKLPLGVFDGLSHLWKLELGSNWLTELPAGAFDGLRNLRELNLAHNRFTELPAGLFAGLTNLERVFVQGNPGAPFPVVVELARTDADDVLAPGPGADAGAGWGTVRDADAGVGAAGDGVGGVVGDGCGRHGEHGGGGGPWGGEHGGGVFELRATARANGEPPRVRGGGGRAVGAIRRIGQSLAGVPRADSAVLDAGGGPWRGAGAGTVLLRSGRRLAGVLGRDERRGGGGGED